MTNKEIIEKARKLFKEKDIVTIHYANGDVMYANALWKIELELDCNIPGWVVVDVE